MGKKLMVLLFAAAIVVSGIRMVQAVLRIGAGGPITTQSIKPNVQSYVFQALNNGATTLRTAVVELGKVPGMVGGMYDQLNAQRPKLQDAIQTLEKTIDSLEGLKSDIQEKTPISTIRDPLLASISTLQTTLPTLLGVFKQLDDAIAITVGASPSTKTVNIVLGGSMAIPVNERQAAISDLEYKVGQAIASIENKDPVFKKDLPQRMDSLADFLRGLAV